MNPSSAKYIVEPVNTVNREEAWLYPRLCCGRHCYKYGGTWFNHEHSSCHSSVRGRINEVTGLKSALAVDSPVIQKWWDFLVNDSVYGELFTVPGWRVMTRESKYAMFEMPAEVFKLGLHPALIYSFLIDSRTPFDDAGWGKSRAVSWEMLTSLNIEPRLAYLMALNLEVTDGERFILDTTKQWNGNHQILNDGNWNTDFSMFLDGKYQKDKHPTSLTSQLWHRPALKTRSFWVHGVKDLVIKQEVGRFRTLSDTIRFKDIYELSRVFLRNIQERRKELV